MSSLCWKQPNRCPSDFAESDDFLKMFILVIRILLIHLDNLREKTFTARMIWIRRNEASLKDKIDSFPFKKCHGWIHHRLSVKDIRWRSQPTTHTLVVEIQEEEVVREGTHRNSMPGTLSLFLSFFLVYLKQIFEIYLTASSAPVSHLQDGRFTTGNFWIEWNAATCCQWNDDAATASIFQRTWP